MSDKAFFDTNLPIALVFQINSLHIKSKKAFQEYSKVYWSNFVKKEFNHRYKEKFNNVSRFFQDYQLQLDNSAHELYSSNDLFNFVRRNYSGSLMDDAKGSIDPFWNEYIGIESHVPFMTMKQCINQCLNDVLIDSSIQKDKILSTMQLTPQRTKSYSNIDVVLKNQGVKDADRNVILDEHDFACFSGDSIDFVTFDEDFYRGARNVEILCFNSIKGKYDFNAS